MSEDTFVRQQKKPTSDSRRAQENGRSKQTDNAQNKRKHKCELKQMVSKF
jgi:hypothetical protein